MPGGKEPQKPPSQFPAPVQPMVERPPKEFPIPPGGKSRQIGKAKASFVTLVRNHELWDLLSSIRQIEDRFNHRYHYPWTFLNDVPFTDEFINMVTNMVSGQVKFGSISDSQQG